MTNLDTDNTLPAEVIKWQETSKQTINTIAGKVAVHLAKYEFSGITEFSPIVAREILPFQSAVLPADKTILAKLFPGYTEPTAEELAALIDYAKAKENYGTVPGEAAALIVGLVKAIKPETAFVFGTARGRIEQQIAIHNPESEIVTIDLPSEILSTAPGKPDSNNIRYRNNIGITDDSKIGDIFTSDPSIAGQVHQILGDSFTFSPDQLAGTMRMIIIDGNHQLPNSLMDLGNALKLSHRNGALIIIDDFRKLSPLNSGVDAAVSIFTQITGLHALMPCPKPGEQGLQTCAALYVIPSGFDTAAMSGKVKDMATQLKSYESDS